MIDDDPDQPAADESNAKPRSGKIILSTGLVLASAGCVFWQQAVPLAGAAPSVETQVHSPAAKPASLQFSASAQGPAIQPQAPSPSTPDAAPSAASGPVPAKALVSAPRQLERLVVAALDNKPDGSATLPQNDPAPADMAPAEPPAALAANISPTSNGASQGRYANGEFTGASADTSWGDVQVKVVVRDGNVAQVQPLLYPDHRRRSIEINDWALPILEHEVLQVQSANVDMVSQATVTSAGYQQSLASALAQAKN